MNDKISTGIVLFSVALNGCAVKDKSVENSKPNFIIWVADDQFLESVGCYGANPNYTPNIDKLASEGMRFTRAYCTSPICTPARSALYTGMYPIKNGAHPNHSGLKQDIPTMPGIMRDLGYRSALVGKEGVHKRPTRPTNTFAWDVLIPHTDTPVRGAEDNRKASGKHREMDWDAIAKFMESDDPKPYCLFVAATLPHGPGLSKIDNGLEGYDANNWVTDQQFAWFMDVLEKSGKKENTVVIFLSDNGSNTPRSKYTLYEPGVNIPLIIAWPGHVKPNTVCDALVDFTDVLPTMMDINAQEPGKEMSGKSLLPLLNESSGEIHPDLFLSYTQLGVIGVDQPYPIRGVVTKQYKLLHFLNPGIKPVKGSGAGTSQEYELFDLKNDPKESVNLAADAEFAGVKKDMMERLERWVIEVGDKGMETEYEAMEMYPELKETGSVKNDLDD